MTIENPFEAPKAEKLCVRPAGPIRPFVRFDFMNRFSWWPLPLIAVFPEAFFGFPFFFAPGWANGWPGFSIYTVWSAGMTTILSVMFISLAIGLGAAICWLIVNRVGTRSAWRGFGLWLAVVAVTTVVLAVSVYRDLYASTREMWPNGYGL